MKRQFKLLFIFFILCWDVPVWALSEELRIVNAIQKSYESVLTLKAKFVQKAFVKMINRTEITKGNVQIKKPGKMKWVYNSPDTEILISDQKNLWLYTPEEEQATKIPIESVYSSNTPALFLAGQGVLTDMFDIMQVRAEKDKFVVTFTPKEVESNLSRLILRANKNNYQITGATVYDRLGNETSIRFRSIRINEKIPENVFNFEVPAGIEIQDFTSSPK
jgi:outer membrane lipoprotein carrier protein